MPKIYVLDLDDPDLTAPEIAIARQKLNITPCATCQGKCNMTHTLLDNNKKHSYCRGCNRDWIYNAS